MAIDVLESLIARGASFVSNFAGNVVGCGGQLTRLTRQNKNKTKTNQKKEEKNQRKINYKLLNG